MYDVYTFGALFTIMSTNQNIAYFRIDSHVKISTATNVLKLGRFPREVTACIPQR